MDLQRCDKGEPQGFGLAQLPRVKHSHCYSENALMYDLIAFFQKVILTFRDRTVCELCISPNAGEAQAGSSDDRN